LKKKEQKRARTDKPITQHFAHYNKEPMSVDGLSSLGLFLIIFLKGLLAFIFFLNVICCHQVQIVIIIMVIEKLRPQFF